MTINAIELQQLRAERELVDAEITLYEQEKAAIKHVMNILIIDNTKLLS